MKLSDYNYNLPSELIADRPPKIRGTSRLLVLDKRSGGLTDSSYANVADFLLPGDLLVINNTQVLPARLLVRTESGVEKELLLLEKHGQNSDEHTSLIMHRGKITAGQKLHIGAHVIFVEEVYDNGTATVSSSSSLWDIAENLGSMPLPPYMHRIGDEEDKVRYQTVFAQEKGSVAAPTASLNMTKEIMTSIKEKGVKIAEVTLHVGLGTFMPIRVDDVTTHTMHQEYFEIPQKTSQAIRATKLRSGRIIALGTTVTRTLEFAHSKIINGEESIQGEADIFIYPGYAFHIVDGLLTNFHAPKSTVLMMAAAFAGWHNLHYAYMHAISIGYKFLSYGDSMLILNNKHIKP